MSNSRNRLSAVLVASDLKPGKYYDDNGLVLVVRKTTPDYHSS